MHAYLWTYVGEALVSLGRKEGVFSVALITCRMVAVGKARRKRAFHSDKSTNDLHGSHGRVSVGNFSEAHTRVRMRPTKTNGLYVTYPNQTRTKETKHTPTKLYVASATEIDSGYGNARNTLLHLLACTHTHTDTHVHVI